MIKLIKSLIPGKVLQTKTELTSPLTLNRGEHQSVKGNFSYNGEFNRCFVSGHIQKINNDRCTIYIKRFGSEEIVACAYKKGKNKLPLKYNIGDYVLFTGKIMQSINSSSTTHHIFYVHSAVSQLDESLAKNKNNCEISGYIKSYKNLNDELLEADLQHNDKLLKLIFKRNYRFMLYDFEDKYKDLLNTHVYLHGHYKLDRIFIDGIQYFNKAEAIINSRINK